MITKDTTYSPQHFNELINQLTPIEKYDGYLIKRDDLFSLNGVRGGKVRQCLKLVYDNLDYIKNECNNTIITAAGLPSPQSTIVSSIGYYFGLNSIVSVPYYKPTLKDVNRINISLSQYFGSKIYGVGNPNISGPEKDVKEMVKSNNYYQVKFGMNGTNVMETISYQVVNIPDDVENIVCIAGSGLSVLGILTGIKKYKKNIKDVYVITLSDYFNKNKKMWYDDLPNELKYDGNLHIIRSSVSYQTHYKKDNPLLFDWTYESKAWKWLKENLSPSYKTLFWSVGIKEYDLSYIQDIQWNFSPYEQTLDKKRNKKICITQ